MDRLSKAPKFTVVRQDGVAPVLQAKRRRKPSYEIHGQKLLAEDEWKRLELSCWRDITTGRRERDALLILLAFRTGARASELLAVEKQDFNEKTKSLFIRGIKGSNSREVPVPPRLCNALKRYVRRLDGDRLFSIEYHRFRQIWEFYRPVPKKLHCLRHTFAVEVFKQTRDLRLVQLALGHRQIANTMVYMDYVYSSSEMKRVLF